MLSVTCAIRSKVPPVQCQVSHACEIKCKKPPRVREAAAPESIAYHHFPVHFVPQTELLVPWHRLCCYTLAVQCPVLR
eukprot:2204486-Rhodomonas_salina.1